MLDAALNREHWSAQDSAELQRELLALAEETYRAFSAKLIPDEERNMLGIRVPLLRDLAKRIAKGNVPEFLAVFSGESHEEVILWGLVVAYSKLPQAEKETYYRMFARRITNWAICDTVAMTEKNRGCLSDVLAYLNESHPFAVRFGLVRLLSCYVAEETLDNVLNAAVSTQCEHYYVNMAVAWLLSVCYVKFPERTEAVFPSLTPDIMKKTRQKIRDSFRVPRERKQN